MHTRRVVREELVDEMPVPAIWVEETPTTSVLYLCSRLPEELRERFRRMMPCEVPLLAAGLVGLILAIRG